MKKIILGISIIALTTLPTLANANGHGHGHGHNNHKEWNHGRVSWHGGHMRWKTEKVGKHKWVHVAKFCSRGNGCSKSRYVTHHRPWLRN